MSEEGYFIEWTGDNYQSVFKTHEADKSQLHTTIQDAFDYMAGDCGIIDDITIISFRPA